MNTIEMDVKDKRARNFTDFDKNMLFEIVQSYLHIVENKKTDSANVKTKNEAWDLIASQFNASCQSGARTAKQLHALYDGMKKKARKNMHDDKKEIYKTGGGVFTPKSDTIDTKIVETLGVQFKPLPNFFDSSSEYLGQDVIVYETEEDKQKKNSETSMSTECPPINMRNSEYNEENMAQLDVAPFSVVESSGPTMKSTYISSSSPMKKRNVISSTSTQSNLSEIKKTNMTTIARRLVDRKNFKDEADNEIKNKKLKILDIEEKIKMKELEMKSLELQHMQSKHEMELKHIKAKQALELQILQQDVKNKNCI